LDSLRQQLLAKRLDLAQDLGLQAQLESMLTDFFNHLKANCVAIYWPIQGEPDLRSMALKWLAKNRSSECSFDICALE
jgi:5-formyltetrahydrofolate cyclo-ligase